MSDIEINMSDIEKLKCLLIDFSEEFEEYRQESDGTQIIELEAGHCYSFIFQFDRDGKYLGCGLGV